MFPKNNTLLALILLFLFGASLNTTSVHAESEIVFAQKGVQTVFEDMDYGGDGNIITTVTRSSDHDTTIYDRNGLVQIHLPARTTIINQRNLNDHDYTSLAWNGYLQVPKPTRSESLILFSNVLETISTSQEFQIGQSSSEKFIFSSPVKIKVSKNESPNRSVYFLPASQNNEYSYEYFKENAELCSPGETYCEGALKNSGRFFLVIRDFKRCLPFHIPNGHYADAPTCNILCDKGHSFSPEENACVRGKNDDSLESQIFKTLHPHQKISPKRILRSPENFKGIDPNVALLDDLKSQLEKAKLRSPQERILLERKISDYAQKNFGQNRGR